MTEYRITDTDVQAGTATIAVDADGSVQTIHNVPQKDAEAFLDSYVSLYLQTAPAADIPVDTVRTVNIPVPDWAQKIKDDVAAKAAQEAADAAALAEAQAAADAAAQKQAEADAAALAAADVPQG